MFISNYAMFEINITVFESNLPNDLIRSTKATKSHLGAGYD